ncbi:hypothetical protein SK128_015110 [Halocaridina rubra]|uniref:Uncharacterized protein n=1 Tax=Halocaridina rubra TaxID=373956 RepID=A0AAN9ABA2_HALRR
MFRIYCVSFQHLTQYVNFRSEQSAIEYIGITAAPSEGRSTSSSPMLDGKHWGPERTVEVRN